MIIVGVLSRGPMLAQVVPITFAVLVLGKWRQLALTLTMAMALFWIAYAVEPLFYEYVPAESSEERSISTRQVLDNVESIFGQGGEQTQGTKEWRLEWWNAIINYTFYGPYFWTGRGFGQNIAEADGFSNWTVKSEHAPLRSPHDVFMMLLSHSGVPGLALWLATLTSWFAVVLRSMQAARRRHQPEWAGLFLLLSCYTVSVLINSSFDPSLEAPMQGIWFWCVFGAGLGSVMIYRRQPAALRLVVGKVES
jgi:O-antigen ligase